VGEQMSVIVGVGQKVYRKMW